MNTAIKTCDSQYISRSEWTLSSPYDMNGRKYNESSKTSFVLSSLSGLETASEECKKGKKRQKERSEHTLVCSDLKKIHFFLDFTYVSSCVRTEHLLVRSETFPFCHKAYWGPIVMGLLGHISFGSGLLVSGGLW